VASAKIGSPTSIDPKDRVDVANDMHDASLAIEEGNEATVIPLLLRVVAKDPQVQAAQHYLGIADSRKGNSAKALHPLRDAEALPYLEKAAAVQADSSEAHSFLADEYDKLGRAADAARERAEAHRLRASGHP